MFFKHIHKWIFLKKKNRVLNKWAFTHPKRFANALLNCKPFTNFKRNSNKEITLISINWKQYLPLINNNNKNRTLRLSEKGRKF